jgi:hypothetical protein
MHWTVKPGKYCIVFLPPAALRGAKTTCKRLTDRKKLALTRIVLRAICGVKKKRHNM